MNNVFIVFIADQKGYTLSYKDRYFTLNFELKIFQIGDASLVSRFVHRYVQFLKFVIVMSVFRLSMETLTVYRRSLDVNQIDTWLDTQTTGAKY